MTTISCHRSTVLRALDETSVRHLDELDGVWTAFRDIDDLLHSVQQRWFTSLTASIDLAIEQGGGDLLDDVRGAYADAVRRHPGLRRVIDDHADHPALVDAIRREHALLARAAAVGHPGLVVGDARRQEMRVPAPRRSLLARVLGAA